MSKPMMMCGHAANATNALNEPACAICVGIDAGAEIVNDSPPDLSGREAICSYGCKHSIRSSSTNLAFFEHRPQAQYDVYYCGCWGWD